MLVVRAAFYDDPSNMAAAQANRANEGALDFVATLLISADASKKRQSEQSKHWDNYDITRTFRPKLLPDDQVKAGERLLSVLRIKLARNRVNAKRLAKERADATVAAITCQKHVRGIKARRRVAKIVAAREDVNEEEEEYKAVS